MTGNISLYGVQGIRCFPCLKTEAQPASATYCFIKKKLNDGQSPKKKVMSKELISPRRKNGEVNAN